MNGNGQAHREVNDGHTHKAYPNPSVAAGSLAQRRGDAMFVHNRRDWLS